MAKTLSSFARAPQLLASPRRVAAALQNHALSRVVRLRLPAPVQRFAQGTLRRLLREFPLLGELLELSRVVIERAGGNAGEGNGAPVSVADAETASALRGDARRAAVPTSKPVAPAVVQSAFAGTAVSAVEGAGAGATEATAASVAGGGADAFVPDQLEQRLEQLRGPSAERAIAAVQALAASDDPRARGGLLGALRNAEGYFHPLVRVAALRALASDRSAPVRDAIVAAIDSVSAEVSLAAIAVLAQYAPDIALPPLRRVIEDRSGYFAPEVRAAAERALARLHAEPQN